MALTLRTLGGLTTAEIARAFWCPSRPWPNGWSAPSARSATPASPTRCRRPAELPERLDSVLATLYLIFNEGYFATGSEGLIRTELPTRPSG